MAAEAHFNWYQMVPGLEDLAHHQPHVLAAVTVSSLLVVTTLAARFAIAGKKTSEVLVPSSRLSFLGFWDLVTENLYKMCRNILGDDAKTYLPIIGTLFLFIFFNNLLGLIPGFVPATDNVNTTLACGLFVFVYYNYVGFRSAGVAYLKHFAGPVWYMAWLLLPIEIISHSVRPFTLALRLKGNMMGDHTVLSVFTHMFPYVVPIPIYLLGLLVSFLQAFIFVMLTMVYISMARDSDHH